MSTSLRPLCFAPLLCVGAALLVALPAAADTPSSIGNAGAYQRASITAAGPGSVNPEFDPVQEEPSRLSVDFLIPLLCLTLDPNKYESQCRGGGLAAAGENLAPVYQQPASLDDHQCDPNDPNDPDCGPLNPFMRPLITSWALPILPGLAFGSADGVYEAQVGVLTASIGNGTLVRGFTNSPNTSFRRAGFYFEFRSPGVTAEFLVGDFLAPGALTAGRVAVRPLTLLWSGQVAQQPVEFDHNFLAAPLGRWSTGLTLVTDLVAPFDVPAAFNAGVGPLDPDASLPQFRTLTAVGWENNLTLLKLNTTEAFAYVDVNALTSPFNHIGVGGHAGMILSAQASQLRVRLQLEGNVGGPGYVAGYFDQLYVIERLRLIGTDETKLEASVRTPASWGYLYRLSVSYLPYVSLFVEGTDRLAFDQTLGANSGRITAGLSGDWLMFGGTLSVSQSGVQNYLTDLLGPGLVALFEGRTSLLWSYLQVITRVYAVGDPGGGLPNVGAWLGLKIRIGV